MSSATQPAILAMLNIKKEFSGVKALRGVDFNLLKGEIHALVGENGAGKSTLMKILSGFYPFGSYDGELHLEGEIAAFSTIKASEEAGIAIIHQELALVPEMSIAENIFLGQECRNALGLIDWDRTWSEAQILMQQAGLKRSPHTKVKLLSVGEQQLVEITKALARKARILILDEPTAALTEVEAMRLLDRLRLLQKEGVSCIYISHRLHEVMQISDRVTILRDGQTVGSFLKSDLDENRMVALMVGRDMTDRYPREEHQRGTSFLEIKNWTVNSLDDDRRICDGINLKAFQGEILGLSGLTGSGRSELFMNILKLWGRKISGQLEINGEKLELHSTAEALAHGLALVSEDRKRYGLVIGMNINQNSTLASLKKFSSYGLINLARELQVTRKLAQELRIKTPSVEQKVGFLSGGNQQKVVLAKWLLLKPKVLILDEPTRGIDVGARYEIYKIMNDLVAQGVIVIMISSDLSEIVGMSDRILVFHEGKVQGELMAAEATQEKIMSFATGRT